MAGNELALVKLFRFDPQVDVEPSYDEFRAPYKERTVLDVLRYIFENLDSGIAFRWGCSKGRCRACMVVVNGQPALACQKFAEKEMRIDPHPRFKVVKDLLVDFESPLPANRKKARLSSGCK